MQDFDTTNSRKRINSERWEYHPALALAENVYIEKEEPSTHVNKEMCINKTQECVHKYHKTVYYLLTYILTPWSRVLLEKLTSFQHSRNSPHFMEPEGSLPHSQVPATCPYPEPARSSPYPHSPFPEDPS